MLYTGIRLSKVSLKVSDIRYNYMQFRLFGCVIQDLFFHSCNKV
jgi:hypothetical protein